MTHDHIAQALLAISWRLPASDRQYLVEAANMLIAGHELQTKQAGQLRLALGLLKQETEIVDILLAVVHEDEQPDRLN